VVLDRYCLESFPDLPFPPDAVLGIERGTAQQQRHVVCLVLGLSFVGAVGPR
jgi:hypothetical protein